MIKKYKSSIISFLIFVAIGIVGYMIPFAQLEGSHASFTISEFFIPSAAGFLPLPVAIIAVFIIRMFSVLISGSSIINAFGFIRMFLPFLAVYYFYKKSKFDIIIPMIAIIGFILHPVGREVWYFSLIWLIPVGAHFFRDRFLLARSLGATFIQHALGGLFFIYLVPTTPELWVLLIPIVLEERLLFGIGISAFYTFFKESLGILNEHKLIDISKLRRFYV